MSAETYKESTGYVDTQAPESFKRHALTERHKWTWKVARSDSWTYGFYLSIGPGAVIIYGDIGEAIFRISAGPEEDVLQWILRCANDAHYTMSKLSNREAYRLFYPGDAVADVEQHVASLYEPEAMNAEALLEEVREAAESGELSRERFYELCHEHDYHEMGAHVDWAPSAFWFVYALRCFKRLYEAEQAKKETP